MNIFNYFAERTMPFIGRWPLLPVSWSWLAESRVGPIMTAWKPLKSGCLESVTFFKFIIFILHLCTWALKTSPLFSCSTAIIDCDEWMLSRFVWFTPCFEKLRPRLKSGPFLLSATTDSVWAGSTIGLWSISSADTFTDDFTPVPFFPCFVPPLGDTSELRSNYVFWAGETSFPLFYDVVFLAPATVPRTAGESIYWYDMVWSGK